MGVLCDRLRLGSTVALDCRTGQDKGRYREKELLFLLVLLINPNSDFSKRDLLSKFWLLHNLLCSECAAMIFANNQLIITTQTQTS